LNHVSNSTPLIHLARIGRLDLLRLVFGEVLVPAAVLAEVRPRGGVTVEEALRAAWLIEAAPADLRRTDGLEQRLGGRGEAETIALAIERSPAVALIDERAAREVCRELGIAVRGTLGVLLAAKTLGHIVSVRPILDKLRATGFWLDDGTLQAVLEIAEESE